MARPRLTYPTDVTAEEWQILKPLLSPEQAGGRPRKYPMREVRKGLPSVRRAGCAGRRVPHDRPPWQPAYQTWRAGTAPGSGFTTPSATPSVPAWGVTPSRRPPSSRPRP